MHFNFPFTAVRVLWTLTFAAQLVLLVVLLGRDRVRRYPWFTASIGLFAFRLLAEVLLSGRMAMIPLQTTILTLAGLGAIVSLVVVAEMAWRAFSDALRWKWVAWAVPMVVVAVWILVAWGPWPARSSLAWDTPLEKLRLIQFAAQKTELLANMLMVELGLLIVLCGSKFKAGWRSHTQKIAIGLSTVAMASLAVQSIWQMIARSAQAHPLSREQYEQIINMGGRLLNANKAVYIVALLWWIVWLWIDEPGAACACAVEVEEAAASEPGAMKIVEATIEPALEAAKTGEIAPEPTEPSSKNAPPPSAE